ncbi:MAG: hypothetical protein M1837_005433 [Sclerophora amabilis]|nr:MAG: hypothetical protein M1837_005433 [Sclerophora amabilis]
MAGFWLSNSNAPPPEISLSGEFTLSAPPKTDISHKPPSTEAFNAPIFCRRVPLYSFRRARVTVAAPWKTLYDQGGLILILRQERGIYRWVKTGIEFYDGRANVSTEVADRYADWSLMPLSPEGSQSVTVEMEREVKGGSLGPSLWIYVVNGEERRPIREVSWVFEDEAKVSHTWVGVYAAKPTPDTAVGKENDTLEVSFKDLVVDNV